MRINIYPTVYIMEIPDALMDKIQKERNCWAIGEEQLCLTLEEALEVDELKAVIGTIVCEEGADVILSP